MNMKILILGGSQFVGRHTIQEALARGHAVTVFNRGNEPPHPGVTTIIGDRLATGGYNGLDGLSFDAVIDTWSTDPIAVQSAVEALRGRINQYIYISTVSVYNFEGVAKPYSEATPLHDPDKTEVQYFKDKVRGERFALQSGAITTLIRPGVILGPHENRSIWRLPWWLQRMDRGGRTLAPGPKDLAMQFIDARDLAKFTIHAAEQKLEGAFNALPQRAHISMGQFLETANEVTGGKAQLCWLDPETLQEAGVGAWREMPIWVVPDQVTVYEMDVSKALGAGLTIRPAEETIADTWAWLKTVKEMPAKVNVGIDPEKEKQVLEKYYTGP